MRGARPAPGAREVAILVVRAALGARYEPLQVGVGTELSRENVSTIVAGQPGAR